MNQIINNLIKESAVGVSIKKIYNHTIKKFKKVIEHDLKEIEKFLRKNKINGKVKLGIDPSYNDFKKWYDWGENGPFYYNTVTLNEKINESDKKNIKNKISDGIQNILDKSEYSEAYDIRDVWFITNGKLNTSYTFSFENVKDFDIYKISDELAKEKDKVIEDKEQKKLEEKLKNYTKTKALEEATNEIVNIDSVKRITKSDIEIIAQKYGIDYLELYKSFQDQNDKKTIESAAKDLYSFLISRKIVPNVNSDGYEKYKKMVANTYSLNDKEIKELDKYFNKTYKFKNIDKVKLLDNLSINIDHHFKTKMKKPLETRLNPKGQMKKLIENYAKENGVNAKELIDYYKDIFLSDVKDDAYKMEKFKDNLVKTVLGRLPRFIYKVVKNVPVLLFKKKGGIGTGTIALWNSQTKKIHLYLKKHRKFKDAIQSMGHEYWHAFEDMSGFKHQSKSLFNKIVDKAKMGDMAKNAMEDFIKVTNLVYLYTRNPMYKKEIENYKSAWKNDDKNYFKRKSGYLWDNVKKNVEKRDFYESLSEVLADTCGYITSGDSGKSLSPSLVVWMNKKFSSINGIKKNSYFEVLKEFNQRF